MSLRSNVTIKLVESQQNLVIADNLESVVKSNEWLIILAGGSITNAGNNETQNAETET